MELGREIQRLFDTYRFNKYALKKYLINDGKEHPFALVIPGGGYGMVCSYNEGVPFAKILNKKGINVFILYYRVKGKAKYPNPLLDVVKAMKHIIKHQEEYHIDIHNYAVYGSSAGGHLAGMYARSDIGYKAYNLPKPKALVLIYPVVSLEDPTHIGTRDLILGNDITEERKKFLSLDLHIDENFPKTYFWTGDNDNTVDPLNSIKLDKALFEKKIKHKFRLYPGLDHGLGIAKDTIAKDWIYESIDFWLDE